MKEIATQFGDVAKEKHHTTTPNMFLRYKRFIREHDWMILWALFILSYFLIMDIVLYMTLQTVTFVNQPKPTRYTPFNPLSVKLLMTCPANHYVINPAAEYFDEITNFSRIFSFITPNMISYTHLVLGFISAYMVSRDSIRTRRYGVLLYEFRMFLDTYDGVVFRSHRGLKGYVSFKSSFGYIIDISCDIVGGIALNYGVLFYLWRNMCKPDQEIGVNNSLLPLNHKNNNNSPTTKSKHEVFTRKGIFIKMLFWGLCMALIGMTWDLTTEKFGEVLSHKLPTTLEEVRDRSIFFGGLGPVQKAIGHVPFVC